MRVLLIGGTGLISTGIVKHLCARGADVTVHTSYPYSISLLGIVVKSGRITSTTTERVE